MEFNVLFSLFDGTQIKVVKKGEDFEEVLEWAKLTQGTHTLSLLSITYLTI